MTALKTPEKLFVLAETRGLIAIEGKDAATFLQGVVSNDATKVTDSQSLYSAFLTPQGKFLHDFFMSKLEGALILDCEGPRQADLVKRLKFYKLRSRIAIADRREEHVVALVFGAGAAEALDLPDIPGATKAIDGGIVYRDPRLSDIGARAVLRRDRAFDVLTAAGLTEAGMDDYDILRISLGLPDGSRDMRVNKAILLENGFDELGGVDWGKGCYMGQELTARTKYRALIKKRLLPITLADGAPSPGDAVMAGEKQAGEVCSVSGRSALALLRLEYLEGGQSLGVNGHAATVSMPDWVVVEKPRDGA